VRCNYCGLIVRISWSKCDELLAVRDVLLVARGKFCDAFLL